MDPSALGLWLLPTRGRASGKLPRFLDAAKATGLSTPGAILVDRDDYAENHEAYDQLDLPRGWIVAVVKGGKGAAAATREGVADLCDGLAWVGWLSDDLIPRTQGWDVKAIEALNGMNFVSTNDGKFAPNKANGATVWSGDLIRAAGYLYLPDLDHFYVDNVWEEIGRATGCWTVLMDVLVEHAHASWTGEHDAITDRTLATWDADERTFARWQAEEKVPTVERVLGLMEAHGVKLVRPDLTGLSVMIATPAGDGRFDRIFMRSLMETEKLLAQYGAKVHFADLSFCSDIALARNRLFATFLRGADTHCLWIDSDQGWRPQDAVTLLLAKKDFAAVAGIRKTFPESYAVTVSDQSGRPLPIRVDPASGFLEVTGVGMAFALLSRACAERMAQTYSDLTYAASDGREEIGVFNPMISNRRYRSEDFAFCDRWLALGGKIHIAAELALEHAGTFVWKGAWAGELFEKMQREQAA